MSVFDRPYAGNWSPNRRVVTRYTPDAILLLNGDTTVPGHKPEKKVIDIQRFVTQMSCDSGVESGSASASFTLSIPKDIGSSLFSDGHSVFTPGLEVHIYMRGYFPVEGLANTLDTSELEALKQVLGEDAGNLAMRPYYHCFHGVTTTANLEYSGGFYSINQSCTGMLHFWQYHDISTNASLFGARPTGSKLKMSLVGHNFTNMSPFSIIYSLYKDTAGSAGGVAFALSANSNQSKEFFGEGQSLFEMTQLYWEKRFQTKMYNLRMFGVNGEQLNSAQTAMLGRMSTSQLKAASQINQRYKNNLKNQPVDLQGVDDLKTQGSSVKETNRQYTMGSFSRSMLEYLERAGEKSGYAVSAGQLKAFVNDIGQWGNVNLFESSYTSKLDIASAASTAVGYEFFQDVDGDLVFKPPLYNMDTSGLEAYRVEPEDVISITRASAEPQCTYMTVKSGQFSNWKGLGLEGEWGVRGQYIDYRLVAKYGWRPGDFDAQFYSDARGAFWAAVARMDVINEAIETANITIPLRPELRPGFPVYVRHLDCFYYVKSMSHSFSYGGQCTTTLQCVAQRKKFLPPGTPIKDMDTKNGLINWGANGITHVNLSRPDLPSVPIIIQDKSGGVKQVGFPNVVMALDPKAISPLAWAFGQDVVDLTNPNSIKNILMSLMGKDNKVSMAHPKNPSLGPLLQNIDAGGATSSTSSGTVDAVFTGDATGNSTGFSIVAIETDANGKPKTPTNWVRKTLTFDSLRSQIENYQNFLADQNEGGDNTEATKPGSAAALQAKAQYDAELRKALLGSDSNKAEAATIFDIFNLIGATQSDDVDQLNSASIVELLGDKKANFSNASTPGYYRYYSSSHPEEKDQAPNTINAKVNAEFGLVYKEEERTMANHSSGQFKKGVLTPPPEILASSALTGRYVEFDMKSPATAHTFRVAGAGGASNNMHTDEMYTLLFSRGSVQVEAMVPDGTRGYSKLSLGVGNNNKWVSAYANAIEDHLNNSIDTIPIDSTLGDAYSGFIESVANLQFPGGGGLGPVWFELDGKPVSNVIRGHGSTRADPKKIGQYAPFQWSNEEGGSNRLTRSDFQTEPNGPVNGRLDRTPLSKLGLVLKCKSIGSCKCYKGKPNGSENSSGLKVVSDSVRSTGTLKPQFIDTSAISTALHRHVAKNLADRIFKLLNLAGKAWTKKYSKKADRNTDAAKNAWLEFGVFSSELNALIGYSDSKKNLNVHFNYSKMYKIKAGFKKTTSTMSPIFPVSDAGGYKHFGSYAYGRGVSLNTSKAGWEMLMSNDPLGEVDSAIVDEFVRNILKNGSEELTNEVFGGGSGSSQHMMVQAILDLQRTNPTAYSRVLKTLKIEATGKDDNKEMSVEKYISNTEGNHNLNDLIATGLINHFLRDDTPGTFTNPLNSSHNLIDVMPGTNHPTAHDEILWDSMVKMNAGDPNSFVYVAPEGEDGTILDNVTKQVKNQMAINAVSHAEYQAELRGKRELPRQSVNFETMFDDWGNLGKGDGLAAWENSAAGRAYEKLSQVFGGETPDDPKLKAAYQRLSDLRNSLESSSEDRSSPSGQVDSGSNANDDDGGFSATGEAEELPPNQGGGQGGDPGEFDPEPEDDISNNPPRDQSSGDGETPDGVDL